MVGTIEELSSVQQEEYMVSIARTLTEIAEGDRNAVIGEVIARAARELITTPDQIWYGLVFGRENGYFEIDDATDRLLVLQTA